jgi:hypothetical protein
MWYGERDEHDPRYSVDNHKYRYSPTKAKIALLEQEVDHLKFSLMKCQEVGDTASATVWQRRVDVKEVELSAQLKLTGLPRKTGN